MVMPPPTVGNDIDPGLLPTVPPVAVTTIEEARTYINACEEWTEFEEANVDNITANDIFTRYGKALTKEVSCSWALYGWPAESQLTFEKGLETWAGYTVKLRARIKRLIQELLNRQKAIENFNKIE